MATSGAPLPLNLLPMSGLAAPQAPTGEGRGPVPGATDFAGTLQDLCQWMSGQEDFSREPAKGWQALLQQLAGMAGPQEADGAAAEEAGEAEAVGGLPADVQALLSQFLQALAAGDALRPTVLGALDSASAEGNAAEDRPLDVPPMPGGLAAPVLAAEQGVIAAGSESRKSAEIVPANASGEAGVEDLAAMEKPERSAVPLSAPVPDAEVCADRVLPAEGLAAAVPEQAALPSDSRVPVLRIRQTGTASAEAVRSAPRPFSSVLLSSRWNPAAVGDETAEAGGTAAEASRPGLTYQAAGGSAAEGEASALTSSFRSMPIKAPATKGEAALPAPKEKEVGTDAASTSAPAPVVRAGRESGGRAARNDAAEAAVLPAEPPVDRAVEGQEGNNFSSFLLKSAEALRSDRPSAFRSAVAEPPAASGKAAAAMEAIQKVVECIRLVHAGGLQEITLQLKPEYLGKMQIRAEMENQQVVATILVENPQVEKRLKENLTSLQESLGDLGFRIHKVEVITVVPSESSSLPDGNDREGSAEQNSRREKNRPPQEMTFSLGTDEEEGGPSQPGSAEPLSVRGRIDLRF